MSRHRRQQKKRARHSRARTRDRFIQLWGATAAMFVEYERAIEERHTKALQAATARGEPVTLAALYSALAADWSTSEAKP